MMSTRALIFTVVLVGAVLTSERANAAECFYCGNGTTADLVQLVSVYGNAELKSDAFAQSPRVFNEECGKNGKKSLKTVVCPHGCIIAEYIGHATISGCARDGMVLQGLSTYAYNDQQYRMSVCSNDECNESFESATANRVKPTAAPTTIAPTKPTAAPSEKSNSTEDASKTQGKSTPRPKPSSAGSLGASAMTLIMGLFVYFYSF